MDRRSLSPTAAPPTIGCKSLDQDTPLGNAAEDYLAHDLDNGRSSSQTLDRKDNANRALENQI